MKQIIIFFLFLIFSSCSSHRTIQQEKIKEKIEIDSTFHHVLTNKNIEIEWIYSDDTTTVPYQPGTNDTAAKPRKKYTPQKIPRYGKSESTYQKIPFPAKARLKLIPRLKPKQRKRAF